MLTFVSVEYRTQMISRSWLAAIATFGVGDVATTWIALEAGAVEGHPLAAPLIHGLGAWMAIPIKLVAFAVFLGIYRAAPRDVRVGVPIGLSAIGTAITAWNAAGILLGHNPIAFG